MICKLSQRKGYLVQVYYKTSDGKKKRLSKLVQSLKEAKLIEAKFQAEVKGEHFNGDNLTFSEVSKMFLEDSKAIRRISTIDRYETNIRVHLLPYFGDKKLSKIQPIEIKIWKEHKQNEISKTTEKKYSFIYLERLWQALRVVFSYAKTKLQIVNNCLDIEGGFKKSPNQLIVKEELHYWTLEEFQVFLNQIDLLIAQYDPTDYHYMMYSSVKVLLSICFFAGLRKGEANALTINDFHDGNVPYLSITKSVAQKVGKWWRSEDKQQKYLITPPKSKDSVRDVPIPGYLVDIIRQHIDLRLSKLEHFSKSTYLCGGYGPIADETMLQVKDYVEKLAGLPHIRIHDLRHSYVSLLINAGTPVNTISKLVGHSSPEITWKVYSHLYPQTINSAVANLENLIKSANKVQTEKQKALKLGQISVKYGVREI